jgi:hypothetical protein
MRTLADLRGTRWEGTAELWLDPLGDQAVRSECTIAVDASVISYTWHHEGKAHAGSITLRGGGADFTDTWHQAKPMPCLSIPNARGLLQVQGAYGPDADWGWRTGLYLRAPSGELVLQMTNITPWGEEARAVRMVCTRQG